LDALEDYVNAFTSASSRTRTLYLDLFAGAPQNFERGKGTVILGSGHRALAADPPFSRVVLCELQPRTAARLDKTLREAHPGRDLVVLAGDCNVEMPKYLRTLTPDWRRYAAVFAMVDQYSAEVTWERTTHAWFAIRYMRGEFGVFTVFNDEAGRAAHLEGKSAQKIFSEVHRLVTTPPKVVAGDILAYDLAVCLNAWCFEKDHSFNHTKGRALVSGYAAVRPLSAAEAEALPILSRGAALRFMLTRLYDWLTVADGSLVMKKDPMEYVRRMRFHKSITSPAEYGLEAPDRRL